MLDAGFGLFLRSVSVQLHLKGVLKLKVLAHLKLNRLSTPYKAYLYECMPDTRLGPLSQVAAPVLSKLPLFLPPEPFKQIKALTKSREAPGMRKHRNYPPLRIPTQKDK